MNKVAEATPKQPAEAKPELKLKTNKRGITRAELAFGKVKEPSTEEVLDDEIPF